MFVLERSDGRVWLTAFFLSLHAVFFVLGGFSLASLVFCAFQVTRMASRRRGTSVLPWTRRSSNVKRDRSSKVRFDKSRHPNRRDARNTSPSSSVHSGDLSETEFGEVMHARRVSVATASPSLRNTPSPENSQRGRNVPTSAATMHAERSRASTRSARGASVRSKETVRNVDFVMVTPELDRTPEQPAIEEVGWPLWRFYHVLTLTSVISTNL